MKINYYLKRTTCFALLILMSFLSILCVERVDNRAYAKSLDEKGSMKNIVAFVSFSGKEPSFPENFYNDVFNMYETSSIGVREYIKSQSNNKLDFSTKMLFSQGKCVVADKSENYYKPAYKWVNGIYEPVNKGEGYDNRYYFAGSPVSPETKGAKQHIEGAYREQSLLREIVSKLEIPENFDGDGDDDDVLDSLVIIADIKDAAEWGSLCWAHMGVCHNFEDNLIDKYYYDVSKKEDYQNLERLYLGGKEVIPYNLIPLETVLAYKATDYNPVIKNEEGHTLYNVGLLCHEALHTVGLYDYYSYEDRKYQSVGEFDIMAKHCPSPQNMLEYMRFKLGWIGYDDFLYINDSGEYTLYPRGAVDGNGNDRKTAGKIVLNNYFATGEYYMVEVRNQSLATKNMPFDGGLSGDGLIVYRVNNMNYTNDNGKISVSGINTNGNMYGKDEVYVYRVGNGKNTMSSLGFFSYSLFGENKQIMTEELKVYNMSSFGNVNKNKNVNNLRTYGPGAENSNSETIIYNSDGKNSGIMLSEIKLNPQDGSVTFKVTLPEPQGKMPILNVDDVNISKYIDGVNRILWNTDVKSGKAHILAVRSTNRLKKLAEKGKTHITIDDFKKGSFSNYKTLYSAQVPLAEKWAELPEFKDETLVFIALEPENEKRAVRYVGCIQVADESFGQFIFKLIDPLYIVVGTISIVVITLVFLALIMNRNNKHKHKIIK